MPDLVPIVARLPQGLCGVVFRHDQVAGRAEMIQAVWRVCRNRRLMMVIAGAGPWPPGTGRHLRGGFGRSAAQFNTASAHSAAELVRAARIGANLAFLSPVFPTTSHPDALTLGPLRLMAMMRIARCSVAALGGIDGATARRLPRRIGAIGAIGALSWP